METCAEMGVRYVAADSPWEIYKQMVRSFATPRSLYKSISVYGGEI